MVCGKFGRHGAAHGVPSDIPVLDLRELCDDLFRRIGIKNRHTKRHVYQYAGDARLPDLIQQRQIGLCLHLSAGVENNSGIGGIRGRQDRQVVLPGNAVVLSHHREGHILRPIVIGHIPEKRSGQNGQRQKNDPAGNQPFFAPGAWFCFHAPITSSLVLGRLGPDGTAEDLRTLHYTYFEKNSKVPAL